MKNNNYWKKHQIRKNILNFGNNEKIEDQLYLSGLKKSPYVFNRSQSQVIITQKSLWPN